MCQGNRFCCLLEDFVGGRRPGIPFHHVSMAVLIERLQGIAQDRATDAKNKDRTERSRRGDADMVILKSGLEEPSMKAQCVLRRRRWAGSFRAFLITFCKAAG